ncbi:hypothetical protein M2651_08900 [Clostridium sp. SYSU_GA19001]|uniref:hypothetical protein n=1 Tax=Clostridium caldaquaticum TaxID=2940653 RepID=UPI0020775595|nr:hypothetical protein [Clostridium caldaquaticum]MCM8711145.1 hypothetical protein [Clostridium caldaquaticum]
MIEIIEIKDKAELKKFIELSWFIYKNDKFWVPPLKRDLLNTLLGKDNPLFMSGEHAFFMAYLNGEAAGRICVGINKNLNEKKNVKEGYITLFESIENKEVAFALFDKAIEWLRGRRQKLVKGPISPTNGDDYKGLLIKGFDGSPVLMNSYNPEYYINFFEDYGFVKHLDLYAYYHNLHTINMDRYSKIADYAMKKYNFTVDEINLKDMDKEMEDIKKVLDISMPEEWEELIPPTKEEIRAEGAKLKPMADKNLIVIARSEGKPIGFGIALPDYNQVLKKMDGKLLPFGFLKFLWYRKKIDWFRVFVLFVIPEFRKKAVSGTMLNKLYINGIKNGYNYAEGSTIGETNIAMRTDIEKLGAINYRTYRIYKKEI